MKCLAVSVQILLFSAVLSLCALSGCDSDANRVPGSWHSLSVSSTSPFFRNALAEYKEGDIRLELGPGNTFSWTDSRDGTKLKGTFEVTGSEIRLALAGEDETIRVRYSFRRQKLVIKTDDSFSFTFAREAGQ